MRVMRYKTEEELSRAIEEYFEVMDKQGKRYLLSGLARHLGVSRVTLNAYSNKSAYSDVLELAKARIEEQLEDSLYKGQFVAGLIFNLKVNYGWNDKPCDCHSKELEPFKILIERTNSNNGGKDHVRR